jgi:hypothetical protein
MRSATDTRTGDRPRAASSSARPCPTPASRKIRDSDAVEGASMPRARHLVEHADRAVIQPRPFQRRPHVQGLLLHVEPDPGRARLRAARMRLQCRRRPVGDHAGADRIEHLLRRSPTQHRTSSPTHAERPAATTRSQDAHGDQQAHFCSHTYLTSASVTTKHPRSVTNVLMQNRHQCPETSQ